MPVNGDERLTGWRKRWDADSTRVAQIMECLHGQPPEEAAQRIAGLPWYSSKNGFHPLSYSPDRPTIILDLRGIPLRGQNLENIAIPFALLDGADFFKANLTGADLSFVRANEASFHEAVLDSAKLIAAHLAGVDLSMANLHGADLSRARMDRADLGWAELEEATLVSAFLEGAVLEKVQANRANFSDAKLRRANFSLSRCRGARFQGADLRDVRFVTTNLEGTDFSRAVLTGADLSLSHLADAGFVSADLEGADFSRSQLGGADLSSACLSGVNLSAATLDNAFLIEVDLTVANLEAASLNDADLSKANLVDANLRDASLAGANLAGTDLRRADLNGCRFRSKRDVAVVDGDTRFGYITPKPNDDSLSGWLIPPLAQLAKEDRDNIDPDKARNLCRQVRMLYRDSGFLSPAASYYEQECYWATRAQRVLGSWWRYLTRLIFLEYFMGYGEKPRRIVLTALYAIILFALLFLFNGVEVGERLIDYGLFSGYVSMGVFLSDFWACLLFSMQCFSTLGLGVLKPSSGFSHAVATVEGLLGFFIIALAIVTYVRKAARD